MSTSRTLISSKNAEVISRAHPGFFAVAGPYAINSQIPAIAREERKYCGRAKLDQQQLCPHAQCVTIGSKAWIIRKTPLISETVQRTRIEKSGELGIKGGRAFVENKERVRL